MRHFVSKLNKNIKLPSQSLCKKPLKCKNISDKYHNSSSPIAHTHHFKQLAIWLNNNHWLALVKTPIPGTWGRLHSSSLCIKTQQIWVTLGGMQYQPIESLKGTPHTLALQPLTFFSYLVGDPDLYDPYQRHAWQVFW